MLYVNYMLLKKKTKQVNQHLEGTGQNCPGNTRKSLSFKSTLVAVKCFSLWFYFAFPYD